MNDESSSRRWAPVQGLRGFLSRGMTHRGNGYDHQMRLAVVAKKCVHGRDKVKRPKFFFFFFFKGVMDFPLRLKKERS